MSLRSIDKQEVKQGVVSCECNNCGHKLFLSLENIHKAKVFNVEDVEVEYFSCPNCGHIYVFKFLDSEVKSLLKQIDDVKICRVSVKSSKMFVLLTKHLDKLFAKLKKQMDTLFDRFSNGTFTLTKNKELLFTTNCSGESNKKESTNG